jgi:hypothetical protein
MSESPSPRVVTWLRWVAIVMAAAVVAAACTSSDKKLPNPKGVPTVPKVSVRLSISPYVDQSEAYIGIVKGFYKDIGVTIEPAPNGKNVPPDQVASLLEAGTIDFAKTAPAIILPSLPQAPDLRHYAYSDLFLGFAIMCQPGFKSAMDFQSEGQDSNQAIASAVKQMVGKTFVFAPEPGPAILYEPSFAKANIGLKDMKVVRVQDAQGLALMTSHRADCQLPGAPIRVTLQSKGFVPIVTSFDLAQAAQPSVDSKELRAISLNGWATTAKYWEKHPDTVLRMASVGWRINDFISANLDQAIAIHVPFVNQLAGTSLTPEEGKVIYTELDPFFTFDKQQAWFEDQGSVYYQSRLIEAQIKAQEESKAFPAGKYTYKDISIAADVYEAMKTYKADTEAQFQKLDSKGITPGGASSTAGGLYASAKRYYEWRDYLDADRFAKAAVAAGGA